MNNKILKVALYLLCMCVQISCMELHNSTSAITVFPEELLPTIVYNFDCKTMASFKQTNSAIDSHYTFDMIAPSIIQAEDENLITLGLAYFARSIQLTPSLYSSDQKIKINNFRHLFMYNENQKRKKFVIQMTYSNLSLDNIISAHKGMRPNLFLNYYRNLSMGMPLVNAHIARSQKFSFYSIVDSYFIATIMSRAENPNEKDDQGVTFLHCSCSSQKDTIVRKLLSNPEIDVNATDRSGRTPLHYACQKGFIKIVELLLNHKDLCVDLVDQNGRTAVYYACKSGKNKIVKLLLIKLYPHIHIN